MANENVIPQLRFPEFSGNWKPNLLGEIAIFSKGKGISKSEIDKDGEIECIRYGELYTEYSETISEVKSRTNVSREELVFSEANDVIIPASGETQIDIATASCILRDGIALGGDLNIIKSKTNGVFLSYYLNNGKKKDIAQLAQGISVVHLYASQLKQLKLILPKPEEQNKIASFIAKVNNQIQLLEKEKTLLEKYKKGISQKIFNQEIRFKDDNGNDFPDWEEKKLGSIGNTINGLTGKTKEDFGEGKPYIQYMQIFRASKIYTNEFGFVKIDEKETQTKVKYGDVFFTTSSETPNEIGISSVLLDEVEDAYLNSFCFGFRPNSLNELVPEFAQFLFRSNNVRNEIIKLAQGSTRFNMSKVEFMKQKISLPCETEQQKIASFLSAIDIQIDQLGTQIVRSKSFKKGLLQKMFV